jgi:hypothetical protein
MPSARGWFYWSGFSSADLRKGATASLGRRWVRHAKHMTGGHHAFFFQYAADAQWVVTRKQRPAFLSRTLRGVLVVPRLRIATNDGTKRRAHARTDTLGRKPVCELGGER